MPIESEHDCLNFPMLRYCVQSITSLNSSFQVQAAYAMQATSSRPENPCSVASIGGTLAEARQPLHNATQQDGRDVKTRIDRTLKAGHCAARQNEIF